MPSEVKWHPGILKGLRAVAGRKPFCIYQLQIGSVLPVIFPDYRQYLMDEFRIALSVYHILDLFSCDFQHHWKKLRIVGISCQHQFNSGIRQAHFPGKFHALLRILPCSPFSSRFVIHFKQPDPIGLRVPVEHTPPSHSHGFRRIQVFHKLSRLKGIGGHHIKTDLRYKTNQTGQMQEFIQSHIVFFQASPVKAGLRLSGIPIPDRTFPVIKADKAASRKTHHAGRRFLQLLHHIRTPAAQVIVRHQGGKGQNQRSPERKCNPDIRYLIFPGLPFPFIQPGNRGKGKTGLLFPDFYCQLFLFLHMYGVPESI